MSRTVLRRARRGQIPLSVMVAMVAILIAALAVSTYLGTSTKTIDGREEIVAWGVTFLGEDVYSLAHEFERQNPQYHVIISSTAERDTTSDSQRLLSAIAGGVPPDVVVFPRFATGEWAQRNALADLGELIDRQNPADPNRLDLSEYYEWAIKEGSYHTPGTAGPDHIYGIPITADLRLLYLNGTLLRKAGLQPPRTWEELREDTRKLTVFRTPGDPKSGIAQLGFAPNFGNSWLYLYAWQAGGELLSPDRTKVTLDSPPVVRALRFMTDIYDDLGGAMSVDAFQQSLSGESMGGSFRANPMAGDLDPFLRGAVAMKIDVDESLRTIAQWKPDMDFIIAPPPMPADQLALGRKPLTWTGGFSLVIPRTARNKSGAFKLIQFLTSWQSTKRLAQGERERCESEGRLYLPSALANRVQFERLANDAVFDNPHMPQTFKHAYHVMHDLLPNVRVRPSTPVGQLLWNQHVRA
ncbi:MAG TPA: extracellular solute-binding protein, partial [Bryobacteraceae bacterium]